MPKKQAHTEEQIVAVLRQGGDQRRHILCVEEAVRRQRSPSYTGASRERLVHRWGASNQVNWTVEAQNL